MTDNAPHYPGMREYKRLLRNQQFSIVGTAGAIMIPENRNRVGLIISAPTPAPVSGESPNLFSAHNVSIAALGLIAQLNPIGGAGAIITQLTGQLTAGAAGTITITTGGLLLATENANWNFQTNQYIAPTTSLTWTVTVVGAAGTMDITATYYLVGNQPQVTLGFEAGPNMVLGNGINIYGGNDNLVLTQEFIGTAIRESIWAIASVPGTVIGWCDIFHP